MMSPSGKTFPQNFIDRLRRIIPSDIAPDPLGLLRISRPGIYRVNLNSVSEDRCREEFQKRDIRVEFLPAVPGAFSLTEGNVDELADKGWVYKQSLSSQFAARSLGARPDERILDMCAAPGSKTSYISMMMSGRGTVTAVEKVRKRFFKLKAVLQLLNCSNVETVLMDARRYRPLDFFDRVLVDAPCSSEGRFAENTPKSWAYWSERKIRDMARKQKGLLLQASRCVRPGGTLLYSTCTFAPEENEAVVDWFMKKAKDNFRLVPLLSDGVPRYPCLNEWNKKVYQTDMSPCMRILPAREWEAFFLAKLERASEP